MFDSNSFIIFIPDTDILIEKNNKSPFNPYISHCIAYNISAQGDWMLGD